MENELLHENNYLQETLGVINNRITESSKVIGDKVESLDEFKKHIWTSKNEMDTAEFGNQIQSINISIDLANEAFKVLKQLKRAAANPYFGRIDFSENEDSEKIYIGLCGIHEDFKFYIYDWRTPIASMFYNYGVGDAKYTTIDGEICGKISLKRQFKFENGTIKHYFDTNINIDDSFLQDILAESSSEKMKNIVTTIQREQNEVIRNTIDRVLIVQGSAGSGKTSVALHRIAYLLYQNKALNSNNIIIFSPNDVFSNYISNVLPELGENNVLESTFSDFAKTYFKTKRRLETYTEFSERYYKSSFFSKYDFDLIKSKLSDDFIEIIDSYLKKVESEVFFKDNLILSRSDINVVGFEGCVILKNDLNHLFKERYSKVKLMERLDYMSVNISDRLGIPYGKCSKTIKKKLKEIISKKIEVIEIYNEVITSSEFSSHYNIDGRKMSIKNNTINYEDVIPLLYLTFELLGYPSESYIKQVVVDEAQDYNKMQYKILEKVFSFSSFTILGDVNQTISPFYKYDNLNDIYDIFKNKPRYIELNKTYRSSHEIIEHNNKILNLSNSFAVRRSNSNSVDYKFENSKSFDGILSDIKNAKEHGFQKIAIITKNYEEMDLIYESLKTRIDLKKIDSKVINNLVVLPVSLAKGLEFDYVIVYSNLDNPYEEKDKYLFYVACTRAQHKLVIYNQKKSH